MIRFGYTILYVEDVVRSIEFYENALGCKRKFIAPGNSYGELITGETTLSFASKTLAAENLKNGFTASSLQSKPFGIEIGFTTDNVDEVFKNAIRMGAVAEAEPSFKPHGQTVAYVRDLMAFSLRSAPLWSKIHSSTSARISWLFILLKPFMC